MNTRHVALIVPYAGDKILLQERSSVTSPGERWGFFGGRIEEGETPIQAVRREAMEELEFAPRTLRFLGTVTSTEHAPVERMHIAEVFITPVGEDLSPFIVHEGNSAKFFTIAEARKLSMYHNDGNILTLLEKELYSSSAGRTA